MAGPSFLGASAEIVHREQQHGFHHHHRQHLQKRDTIVSTVEDVVATVSVVQLVDSNGVTVATRTVFPYAATPTALPPQVPPAVSVAGPNLATATPTPALPFIPPTTSIAAVVPTTPPPVVVSTAAPAIVPPAVESPAVVPPAIVSSAIVPPAVVPPAIVSSATVPPAIVSSSNPAIDTTIPTLPSTPTTSGQPTESKTTSQTPSSELSAASHTSKTTQASTSLTTTALSSNTHTISSTPANSILSIIASSNSTWPFTANSSMTGSASLSTVFTSSSGSLEPTASSSLFGSAGTGSGIGATGTNNGVPTPSVTSNAGGVNGTSSDNSTPSTPVVVGSVVGSIAGLALIVVALLFLLRFRKQRSGSLPLGSEPADQMTSRSAAGGGSSGPAGMTQRSVPWALPAALAGLAGFKRNDRESQSRSVTASSAGGSERGFYRVSGRKIQSVLESGGDGYGDTPGPSRDPNIMSASLPQGSTGVYGGPGASSSNPQYEAPMPVLRPSPARTPNVSQRAFTPSNTPPLPHLAPAPWSDAVGRSLPSNDGSHVSRFTEEV